MPFGVHNHLKISICQDVKDAYDKGFNHAAKNPQPKALKVENVIVILDGTVSHKSTVDFVCKDEQGNEYVFMMTGALLKSIPT